MASCVVHLRVSKHVLAELDALCGTMGQSRSAAIRQSVQYVLDHPELWTELLIADTTTAVEDPRTPAQIETWERDKAQLTCGANLSQLLQGYAR